MNLPTLGWTWTSPFLFTSKSGEAYPLTTTSPALLRRVLAETWQEQLADQAAVKIGVEAFDLSHAKAALADKRLTIQDRSLLVSYLTPSIWTKCRLKEASYNTDAT